MIFNTCGVDTIEKEYSKELDLKQYNSYMSAEYSIYLSKLSIHIRELLRYLTSQATIIIVIEGNT